MRSRSSERRRLSLHSKTEGWTSSTDLRAGVRWSQEISDALRHAEIGIVCVTASNHQEPWLLFESGALANSLKRTFVCPYLIQTRSSELSGPLTQFQPKMANRDGTWDLVSTINDALGLDAVPKDRLERNFDRNWPSLEAKLQSLPQVHVPVQRPQQEMMEQILKEVGSIRRALSPRSKSSKGLVRTTHAEQVDRVLRLIERTGRVEATRAAAMRQRLGGMAPPILASVYELLREWTATNESVSVSDAEFSTMMTKIGAPLPFDETSAPAAVTQEQR